MQILFLLLRYDKLVNVTKKQYIIFARVVELVDTLALGASAFGRGGSSPLICTIDIIKKLTVIGVVMLLRCLF